MHPKLIKNGKKILSKLVPDSTKLRYFAYLPKLNAFHNAHPEHYPIFSDRYKMYDYINESVIGGENITYCEFGVFEGATIKYWAKINPDADSKFYGFDTFTGLPETWDHFISSTEKQTFDVNGETPVFDDGRVTFIKGLFQDTLSDFLKSYDRSQQLVIHNDSDLYSSTLYMLTTANSIIVPGTIIIFDEFSSLLHEFRALDDYCSAYLRSYEVIAATEYCRLAVKIK